MSHEISPTDRNRLRCNRWSIRFSEKVSFELREKSELNQKEIKLEHKNRRANKSGNRSRAVRSARQTETDYGETSGG